MDRTTRVARLRTRHTEVTNRRLQAQGEATALRQQLESLLAEIREAGYDPSQLKTELEQAERELDEALTKFETELEQAERALGIHALATRDR